MNDTSRIEELRRRIETNPASIVFGPLAEEYRRNGDHEEAVRVCRAGLAQHPGYLSARVTLGRSLMELEQYVEARAELERVLRAAPDNLAAIRALAEIHQRAPDTDALSGPADHAAHGHAPLQPEPAAPVHPVDPSIDALEAWLGAILADRGR